MPWASVLQKPWRWRIRRLACALPRQRAFSACGANSLTRLLSLDHADLRLDSLTDIRLEALIQQVDSLKNAGCRGISTFPSPCSARAPVGVVVADVGQVHGEQLPRDDSGMGESHSGITTGRRRGYQPCRAPPDVADGDDSASRSLEGVHESAAARGAGPDGRWWNAGKPCSITASGPCRKSALL